MGKNTYYPKKQSNQTRHHVKPYKKKYYPKKHKSKPTDITRGFFNGNLSNNMKFGAPGDHLSGYVKREIRMKDRYGNETTASEKQFFNSGKNFNIKIKDDGTEEKS